MNNSQWEIDGYLLGDPTLDRQAFEQKMLDDPILALQVAEASEALALLARASARVSSTRDSNELLLQSEAVSSATLGQASMIFERAKHWRAKILLAFAASVLLGLGVFAWRYQASVGRLDELAINWLALEREVINETSLVANDVELLAYEVDAGQAGSLVHGLENSASEDWLLDSAVAFFSDSGS